MICGVTLHMLPHLSGVSHLHLNRPLVVITGGGHFRESNHQGSLARRGPNMSTFWERIHYMQFLSYDDKCSVLLSLKYMKFS